MLVFPRFSHHSLSWRLLPHRHTSYSLQMFIVLAAGVLLASVGWAARSAGEDCGVPGKDKCTGSYVVTAVVPGARPTKPVIITSPTNGQSFSTNPITVTGTCPAKTLVKIFSNGIMVGSLLCPANGQFSIPVDLVIGKNDLTAMAYNAADQEGPSSAAITVTLNQPVGAFGFSSELILQSVNFYRGSMPGQEIVWPIEIVGGTAPYAVSIDWGDGTSEVISRPTAGPFTVKHTYKKVGGYLGSYPLIIKAADAAGRTAYLQLTTIVNAPTGGTSTNQIKQLTGYTMLWPLWVLVFFMVTSFWLGERREKKIMTRQLEALA